jgi:enoyl-CoA hydratase/carnithine racemase
MSLVRVEEREHVWILTLERPPANAFNPELVEDVRQALRLSGGRRAVVLASSSPTIFSGGWDLKTLVTFDRPAMESFLEAYCDLVREIFVFGAPVVAALSGHTMAGGLIVAAAADERIAADGKGQFCLPEVDLGVPVPLCLLEIFRHVLGPRGMERLAATGDRLSVERALARGLVDEIVAGEELLTRSVARAGELSQHSLSAHAAIKRRSRASALARFDQARERDPFLDVWFSPDAQERVAALVATLSRKA